MGNHPLWRLAFQIARKVSDFDELQEPQAGMMLPIECRPPFDSGMTWSIVRLARCPQ